MPSSYRIRWKGRTEGPYARDEILVRLARGDLSLVHRVEMAGEWRPLSDLFADKGDAVSAPVALRTADPTHAPAHTPPPVATTDRVKLGYFLSGLTFAAPLVATLPAIAYSGWIRRHGHRDDGNVQLAFITMFTSLGLGFWHLVRQAYLNGHLG